MLTSLLLDRLIRLTTNSYEFQWTKLWIRHITATFFNITYQEKVSEKSVILLGGIDTESVVGVAWTDVIVPHDPQGVPEKNLGKESCKESQVGVPQQQVERNGDNCETDLGKEAEINHEDFVVAGLCSNFVSLWVWVWGTDIIPDHRQKETRERDCVWSCCWHHFSSTMWVLIYSFFSVNIGSKVFCWPVIQFYKANYAVSAETWRWLPEVVALWCMICMGTFWLIRINLGLFRNTYLVQSSKMPVRHQRGMLGNWTFERIISRLFHHESWTLSILHCANFIYGSGSFFPFFPVDACFPPRVPGREDVSTGVEIDSQSKGCRTFVNRRLLPLGGGRSRTLWGYPRPELKSRIVGSVRWW